MKEKDDLIVEKSDYEHKINENDTVYHTDLGKYSKIAFISNPNKKNSIRKLNKNEYLNLNTNEIKQYNLNKATSRSDVNRKLRRYEEIVLTNFSGGASELFITLTCKANITDIAVIKQYYNTFISNIKKDYKDIDYIALFEQTAEWCWHIHLFIKNNKHKKLFIPHNQLLNYWGQGAVYVMQNKNTFQSLRHSKEKREDRLERFTHFPKSEKLYHKSKGIKIPQKEKMTYKECPEFNSDKHKRISSKTYNIKNPNNNKVVNTIATEMYKKTETTSDNKVEKESTYNNQATDRTDNIHTKSNKALSTKDLTEKEINKKGMKERLKKATEFFLRFLLEHQ